MRLMISGSREATTKQDAQRLNAEIEKLNPAEILHGGAQGADMIAAIYATNKDLPETIKLPNYKMYGKHATHIRNDELIKEADAVLCYYAKNYPERTPGTWSVAQKAKKQGKLIAEIWRDKIQTTEGGTAAKQPELW